MYDSEQLIKGALARRHFFGYSSDTPLPDTWGVSIFAVYHGSPSWERSNWEVLTQPLLEQFPNSFKIVRCGLHGGWSSRLVFDTRDAKAVEALLNWVNALNDSQTKPLE